VVTARSKLSLAEAECAASLVQFECPIQPIGFEARTNDRVPRSIPGGVEAIQADLSLLGSAVSRIDIFSQPRKTKPEGPSPWLDASPRKTSHFALEKLNISLHLRFERLLPGSTAD